MPSAGSPLASRTHRANTQSAPPPFRPVSISESHSVTLRLLSLPHFLSLPIFIHLPNSTIFPYLYLRAITVASTFSCQPATSIRLHCIVLYSILSQLQWNRKRLTPLSLLYCHSLLFYHRIKSHQGLCFHLCVPLITPTAAIQPLSVCTMSWLW